MIPNAFTDAGQNRHVSALNIKIMVNVIERHIVAEIPIPLRIPLALLKLGAESVLTYKQIVVSLKAMLLCFYISMFGTIVPAITA